MAEEKKTPELLLSPSFLKEHALRFPKVAKTTTKPQNSDHNEKTQKKIKSPQIDETTTYLKRKKSKPYYDQNIEKNQDNSKNNENFPKIQFFHSSSTLEIPDKLQKTCFPPKQVFFEDECFLQKNKGKTKRNIIFQRPIFYYSNEKIWEFRVFKDSELGVKKAYQLKIKQRLKDDDCQTDSSDLEYAENYLMSSIRGWLKSEKKAQRRKKNTKN